MSKIESRSSIFKEHSTRFEIMSDGETSTVRQAAMVGHMESCITSPHDSIIAGSLEQQHATFKSLPE